MNLQTYYQQANDSLQFTREKASHFAKDIAGDFNPIHDVEARRFCVPGDLLFAVLLEQHGLFRNMEIEFAGMVTEQSTVLTNKSPGMIRFIDTQDADFIIARHDEQSCGDKAFVNELSQAYVNFSGQTFPHILVPMMREHDVMINPARPIVMYRRMSLSLDTCGGDNISLAYTGAQFEANGKKGEASLFFDIKAGEDTIGTGMKNMLLSGLRPFEQKAIDDVIAEYDGWKSKWQNTD